MAPKGTLDTKARHEGSILTDMKNVVTILVTTINTYSVGYVFSGSSFKLECKKIFVQRSSYIGLFTFKSVSTAHTLFYEKDEKDRPYSTFGV